MTNRYRYTAYSKQKKLVNGMLQSASMELAEQSLYSAGYVRIMQLQAIRSPIDWKTIFFGKLKVNKQALYDFTNELTMLTESGLSLVTALRQLERQSGNSSMNKVISGLVADIQAGMPFSKALTAYPGVFSETYCNMVEANEKAGTLDGGLKQIAKELKQEVATRAQVQRAIMQPAIVGVVAIGVAFLLITVVLPPLVDIFRQMGSNLPLPTRILIGVSDFLKGNMLAVVLAVASLAVFTVLFSRQPKGKKVIDRLMLKLPLIGDMVIWYTTARLSRTLSNLLKAGLLLPDAINTIIRSIGNSAFRKSLTDLRTQLLQGQSLSTIMSNDKLFPQLLVEMANVGQVSGELDAAFAVAADYYEVKMERGIAKVTSLIEPVLILCLGLLVGFIAISVISTIYGLVGSMK